MFTGIQSGTISGGSLGVGNFTRTISNAGNVETIATQVAYAGGKNVSRDATITRNADGSITKDVSITLANGNTIQRDINLSKRQDGTRTITGSITNSANTLNDTISGTRVNDGIGSGFGRPDADQHRRSAGDTERSDHDKRHLLHQQSYRDQLLGSRSVAADDRNADHQPDSLILTPERHPHEQHGRQRRSGAPMLRYITEPGLWAIVPAAAKRRAGIQSQRMYGGLGYLLSQV